MKTGDFIITKIGKAEVIAINDFSEYGPAQGNFPLISMEEWEKIGKQFPELITKDLKNLYWTYFCYILKVDGRVILVDTGVGGGEKSGNFATPQWQGVLPEAMNRAGVKEEDVTDVVISHIHGDHIGWNVKEENGKYVKRFPNAVYYARKADYDAYYEGLTKPAFADGLFEMCMQSLVDAGNIILVTEDKMRISDSVIYESFPGHTPGLSCVVMESDGEILVLPSDGFATPLQVADPDISFCWDIDKKAVCDSRRKILDVYGRDGAFLGACHFGLGKIYRDGQDVCWRALQ